VSIPLIISREAEADLAEAKEWYERQGAGLGRRLLRCVEEALDRIRLLPESYREVVPGVRRAMVRRFPYGVYYRFEHDTITVIAIYHFKRDPRGRQDRI
jgi:toxin ParE1/3/4